MSSPARIEEIEETSGQTFDLAALYFDLTRFCENKFRRLGCLDPADCAEEVVLVYVWDKKLRGPGRCEITDDTISINLPEARNQKKVLFKLLSFEVLSKRNRCDACRFKNSCPIAGEVDGGDDEKRITPKIVADPATPEAIFRETEIINKFLISIKDARHRQAFELHVLEGWSHKAIAKQLHVKAATLRKWFARERRNLRRLFSYLVNPHHSTQPLKQPADALVSTLATTGLRQSSVSKAPTTSSQIQKGVR